MTTVANLVDQLNHLLQALNIPITLESPTELTPSLLLAVLESILSTRLPLLPELRKSASSPKSRDGKTAKIQCMKIFLGVLETDVLKMDVGLSKVDPRKLAAGEWNEVVFVGELLCWIGRKVGLLEVFADDTLQQPNFTVPAGQSTAQSPSTVTTLTTLTRKSIRSPGSSPATADTSNSLHDLLHLGSVDPPSSSHLSPLVSSRPRCIHEVPSPDDSFGAAMQNHSARDASAVFSLESPSVRYAGYIAPVDEDLEIKSFESNRSSRTESSRGHRTRARAHSGSAKELDLSAYSHFIDENPHTKTVALLKERARLLRELAEFQAVP